MLELSVRSTAVGMRGTFSWLAAPMAHARRPSTWQSERQMRTRSSMDREKPFRESGHASG